MLQLQTSNQSPEAFQFGIDVDMKPTWSPNVKKISRALY